MRRFLITSPKFAGKVELIYNDAVLVKIDFTAATLTLDGIKWIKNATPVLLENLELNFGNTTLRIAEVEFDVSFDDFKREYPSSRNMYLAEVPWVKLSNSTRYLCFIAAIKYAKYCERLKLEKRYIMLPEKFIKTEQWRNDWDKL